MISSVSFGSLNYRVNGGGGGGSFEQKNARNKDEVRFNTCGDEEEKAMQVMVMTFSSIYLSGST